MSNIQEKVIDRINNIKEEIHSLQTNKYYSQFKESFSAYSKVEVPEDILNDWIDRLTVRSFNEELKDAFPYIYRLVDETQIPVKEIGIDDILEDDKEKKYDENDLRPLLQEIGSTARMIGATLQNTANPTMLEAGYKANVIPGTASAVIDGRFLPGYEAELNETIRAIVGPDILIETISHDIALEVDFEASLVDAMKSAILAHDPEGIPVPYLVSGGTDNKALSELGIVGYGFSPLRLPADLDFMALFHGVDERIPLESLEFGVKALEDFLLNS